MTPSIASTFSGLNSSTGSRKVFVVATTNPMKSSEISAMLAGSDFSCIFHGVGVVSGPWREADALTAGDEIQGSAQEVAVHKARTTADMLGQPCVVEDTSLVFNSPSFPSNTLPGPYIKHFAKDWGHAGLKAAYDSLQCTSATARCTFAFCEPGGTPTLFVGTCDGDIVSEQGVDPPGAGWDAVFAPYYGTQPDGTRCTFAELRGERKNAASHRRQALDKLTDWLATQPTSLWAVDPAWSPDARPGRLAVDTGSQPSRRHGFIARLRDRSREWLSRGE